MDNRVYCFDKVGKTIDSSVLTLGDFAMALADLDDDFEKAPETPRFANILDELKEGEYDFELETLEVKDESKAGPIATMRLILLTDGKLQGKKGQLPFFLTKEAEGGQGERVKDEGKMSELKLALMKLGFDPANWTRANQRPFSVMLKRASDLAGGLGFKAKLKKGGDKKQFNNLTILGRIMDGEKPKDGKPLTFGAEEMKPAPEPFSV